MATLASLLVVMGMDNTGLKTGAAQAEGSIAKVGASAKSTFGSVVPLAAAAAGVALVKFGIDAVSAASDLHESINKVDVVFQQNAETIKTWAEGTSGAMGISEQAALEAAGTFGNLFDAMGLAENAGAEMSTTLVGLAADLASFNNADPTDVLQALQSGLTGQIRPLRQFGIEISEAAIQQEAFSQGIKKSTSEMTLAEKVQLRYALILKQTGNAQGDFARTSEGLANQQRIMAATWEDLQATLGELLLPAVTAIVSAMSDLGRVLLFVTGGMKDLDQATKDAAIHVGSFELDIANFFIRFGGHLPIVGESIKAWGAFRDAQDAASQSTALTGYQLDVLNEAIKTGDPTYIAARDHWEQIADAFLGVTPRIDAARGGVDAATQAFLRFLGVAPHVEKVTHEVQRFGDMSKKALDEFRQGLVESVQVAIGTFKNVGDAFEITAKQLAHQADVAVKIARQEHADLKEIMGSKDLGDAAKEALANLPADQRHAWVEGGKAVRDQITKDAVALARLNGQSLKGVIDAAAKQAHSGGEGIGRDLDTGIAGGIGKSAGVVSAAATAVVTMAIAAARQAAQAASPSKKMFLLGLDLMAGLQKGITDNQQKVIDAAQKVIDQAVKAMEKEIEGVSKMLDKIQGKASDFRSAISSGFQSFLDLSKAFTEPIFMGGQQVGETAPSPEFISQTIQNQVAGATQFADILKALQTQGASAALLKQIGEAGPASIGFAQGLLQGGPNAIAELNKALKTIADLSGETAKGLSEEFFGERVDDLKEKLEELHEDLQVLKHPQRLDVVMHGDDQLRRWLLNVLRESQLSRPL